MTVHTVELQAQSDPARRTPPGSWPTRLERDDVPKRTAWTWSEEDRGFSSPCWIWGRPGRTKGYGIARFDGRSVTAHRAVYLTLVGPIPEGLDLDHLCRVRECVNPEHLEPVTRRENILRGMCNAAINARKTHCVNGHEFSGENLILGPAGTRKCRICRDADNARWGAIYREREQRLPPTGERTHCPRGHAYTGENLYVNPKGGRVCRTCKRENYKPKPTGWVDGRKKSGHQDAGRMMVVSGREDGQAAA